MRITLGVALLLLGCGGTARDTAAPDSAFAALQERGKMAMGVDQYSSTHIFESLPDGGRIVLQRDSTDSVGTAVIRAHMSDIASKFAAGDFTIPGMVHDMVVPGTVEMTARHDRIRYQADTLPPGRSGAYHQLRQRCGGGDPRIPGVPAHGPPCRRARSLTSTGSRIPMRRMIGVPHHPRAIFRLFL